MGYSAFYNSLGAVLGTTQSGANNKKVLLDAEYTF